MSQEVDSLQTEVYAFKTLSFAFIILFTLVAIAFVTLLYFYLKLRFVKKPHQNSSEMAALGRFTYNPNSDLPAENRNIPWSVV